MVENKNPCKFLTYMDLPLRVPERTRKRRLLMNAIANEIDLDDVYNVI